MPRFRFMPALWLLLIGAPAQAQDAQWPVGAWQGWTAEPVTGGPVAYGLIIDPNGTYYRTYRPQHLRGGAYTSSFTGPNQLTPEIFPCRLPYPQLCTVQLQRTN